MYVLEFIRGPLAGQRFPVRDQIAVGRTDVDIVLNRPDVSRRHAIFRVTDGGLEVEDLGSLNGTTLNGGRVSSATHVVVGDRIRIGETLIEIAAMEADDEPGGGRARAPTATAEPAAVEIPGTVVHAPAVSEDETQLAQPSPLPLADPEAAGIPVLGQATTLTHLGERFVLGSGSGFYGIWDRRAPQRPLQTFPQTESGWADAWILFSVWEPKASAVGDGTQR